MNQVIVQPDVLGSTGREIDEGGMVMITGRCECAKVRYEVRGELPDFCH